MLTALELAALIAAVVWSVLVAFLCVALVKLIRLLNETRKAVAEFGERTGPLLDDVSTTVESTNAQLTQVAEITANAQSTSEDLASMTALTRSVVTGPLVRVAAFSYGLRRVLGQRRALAIIRSRRKEGPRS